jgi:hypothetical protein
LASDISRGKKCSCETIQPRLPPLNDALPFSVSA